MNRGVFRVNEPLALYHFLAEVNVDLAVRVEMGELLADTAGMQSRHCGQATRAPLHRSGLVFGLSSCGVRSTKRRPSCWCHESVFTHVDSGTFRIRA